MLRNCKIRLVAFLSAAMMLSSMDGQAQVSVGGTPLSWSNVIPTSSTAIVLPAVDEANSFDRRRGSSLKRRKTTRFGFNHEVTIDVLASCAWESTPTHEIGRLAIQSDGARSINLIFNDFYLEDDVSLFLYNASKEDVIGAFTSANNKPYRTFALLPIPGDVLIFGNQCSLG